MDALSELLRVVKLDSALFINGEFSEPWCLSSPDSLRLAPMLTKSAAHVIIYHLVASGSAYVELPDGERIALEAGDIVTFPHGDGHLLGGGGAVPPMDASEALPGILARGMDRIHGGGGGVRARFICGFLACDPVLCQSFIGGLPRLIKVNLRADAAGQWLENSLEFSVQQAAKREPGADTMLTKLAEALFSETLRRYVRDMPPSEVGWFAGSRDPGVGKALTLLHHRPEHAWTLAELATQVGMSRTVLVERFRHFLGEPPMAYLTRWRLRLGARDLATTGRSIAEVAAAIGYESESSFNRAFKREYGIPPARYRKERASATSATAELTPDMT